MVLQLKIGGKSIEQEQTHRNRRKYAKANYINLTKFYSEVDWDEVSKAKDVQI